MELPSDHPLRKLISKFRKKSERSLMLVNRHGSDVEVGSRKNSFEITRRLSSHRMSVVTEHDSSSPGSSKSRFTKGLLDGLVAFSSKKASGGGSRRSSCVDQIIEDRVTSSPIFENNRTHKNSLTKPISKWCKIVNQSTNKSPSKKSPLRQSPKVHPVEASYHKESTYNAFTNDGFNNPNEFSLENQKNNRLSSNFTVPQLRLDNFEDAHSQQLVIYFRAFLHV